MSVTRLPTAKRRKVKNPGPVLRESGNVVIKHGITKLDIPAARIIAQAADADLQDVVVIGYDQDGEFYFASSHADGGDVLWLLECAKRGLMGD